MIRSLITPERLQYVVGLEQFENDPLLEHILPLVNDEDITSFKLLREEYLSSIPFSFEERVKFEIYDKAFRNWFFCAQIIHFEIERMREEGSVYTPSFNISERREIKEEMIEEMKMHHETLGFKLGDREDTSFDDISSNLLLAAYLREDEDLDDFYPPINVNASTVPGFEGVKK